MNESKASSNTNFSLIDLKTFEQPALKLIDAVRGAVGILYEPRRIVKRAQAEAEAAIIKAEGEVIADGVAERARRRMARIEWQEDRRQENIEAVTALAIKYLPSTVDPEPVDSDWVTRFF